MLSPEPKHQKITNAGDNLRPPVFWQTPVPAYPSQSLLIVACFNVNFKPTNPMSPVINDEIKITNFALLIMVSLSKARSVIKIDIVNPMPPKNPTPIIDFQFKSSGSLQSPNETAKNVNRKMPSGFPTISPAAIPKL